jgi:hypothetical protein
MNEKNLLVRKKMSIRYVENCIIGFLNKYENLN